VTLLSYPMAAVWHALNHYAYRDAVFLAERLYAEVHSEEALFLLATCYYRSGKAYKAYLLTGLSLSSGPMQPCVDVFLFFGLFFLEYHISTTAPHQC
uniref:Uncharacterized protein n=1 Tax=Oncorhynchus tshawytscha TaxID=74940 RepID=A0A8C8HB59_ONCTS